MHYQNQKFSFGASENANLTTWVESGSIEGEELSRMKDYSSFDTLKTVKNDQYNSPMNNILHTRRQLVQMSEVMLARYDFAFVF